MATKPASVEAMDTFLDVLQKRGASGDDANMAIMMIIAHMCGNQKWSHSEGVQDAYLNWLMIGVENILKTAGARQRARANPLVPTNTLDYLRTNPPAFES